MNNASVSGYVERMIEDFRYVIQDPAAEPMLFLTLFGIVALLALIGVVIVYYIYTTATRGRFKLPARIPVGQDPREVWLIRLAVLGTVVALVWGGNYYTGSAKFCANCHSKGQESKTLAKTVHKGVGCLACHQQPGISGFVAQKIDYTRWIWVTLTSKEAKPGAVEIGNLACLKCHREVSEKTVESQGIRVRHSDFLAAGKKCMECHGSTAHPGLGKSSTPSMDQCVKCHNGTTAASGCDKCHASDIGKSIRVAKRGPIKIGTVKVERDFCYRCHDSKPCTSCHGVQMPHPVDWISNVKHAKPAFVNQKVCWRCHDLPQAPLQPALFQSCGCHGTMGYHGDWNEWLKQHGPIATGARPGDGENERCYDCHGPNLCDYCHEGKGYKGKYPRSGQLMQ